MADERVGSASYFARNASVTLFYRGLGAASGIILDSVILALFGLSRTTDSLFAALALPVLVTSALDVQMPKVLVPVFTHGFKEDRSVTWALLSNLIVGAALLLSCLSLAVVALGWLLLPVQVPGLAPETLHLAIRLQMVVIWLVVIQGAATLVGAALYANHHFRFTSSAKVITNAATITTVLALHRGIGIYAVAFGMVLGSTIQLVVLLFAARSYGFRFSRVQLRDPRIGEILKLCLYPFLGQAVGESKVFLENFLSSFLPSGTMSAVRYASRIVESASGVLVGGLVATIFPAVAHYAAVNDRKEMKRAVLKAMRLTTLVGAPVCLWLVFCGTPLVVLTFQHGHFSQADSALTGVLIALLAPYALFSRLMGVAVVPFYAIMDTRTPLISVVVFLGGYAAVCVPLFSIAGVYTFPIATSIATVLTTVVMYALMQKKFGAFDSAELKQFGGRTVAVVMISALGFFLSAQLGQRVMDEGVLANWIRFALPSTIGLTTFLATATFFQLFRWQVLFGMYQDPRPTNLQNVVEPLG